MILLLGIYLTSFYSYLLFHTLAELISIIIACGIFVIAWNSRKNIDNSFILVVGISFLYVGIIDLVHTLAYSGMNIFVGYNTNLPTQLWIAARYLQAISFLFGALVVNKKVNPRYLIVGYTVITILLVSLIFGGLFPMCYIEGSGLTPFKIISEYIIDLILLLSVLTMFKFRDVFDKKSLFLIISSILATIISELAFTFYVSAYGFSNLVGHILKIIAFFLLYKAIIEIGLETPFDLVFRRLKISEQKITEAFSELDQMFNAALPLRIIDLDCKIIKVNDTFCGLFHINREAILGEICYEVFPHEFCHTEKCSMKHISSGKEEYNFETHQTLIDGTDLTLIVNSVPYRNPSGELLGLIQNYTDITIRKKAEQQIQYQAKLVQDVSDAIISTDTEFNILSWNKTAELIYGWTEDEVIGKNVRDIIPVDYVYDVEEKVLKQFFEKGFWKGEVIQPVKDGSMINILSSVSLIKDSSNKPIGAVATNRDITEIKIREEKIANLAKFPSENPNPVIRVNNDRVIYCNKAGEILLDIKSGNDPPLLLRDDLKEVMLENKMKIVERELSNKIYSFVITPVEGVNYVNIYGLDITERILAERRLEKLISTISHELRTPITVILMSLDYLKNHKGSITPELNQQLMEGISKNTTLLHKLAEDILVLSRIDEKRLELEWMEYNPLEIINEILSLMKQIGKEKGLVFELDMDENIRLKGDSRRIDQIFRIIIDNAIKYSKPNSKIKIKAIKDYQGKYNSHKKLGVLFQFEDQGIGIHDSDLPRLFERFFRSDQVADISGTGLGLSIAKELVELHNGEIFVESEYGKGSIFSIFLPKINTHE